MLSFCLFKFSVGVRAFVIGLSQISTLFSCKESNMSICVDETLENHACYVIFVLFYQHSRQDTSYVIIFDIVNNGNIKDNYSLQQ